MSDGACMFTEETFCAVYGLNNVIVYLRSRRLYMSAIVGKSMLYLSPLPGKHYVYFYGGKFSYRFSINNFNGTD